MKIKGFKDTIEWYNKNAKFYNDSTLKAFSIHDRNQIDEFAKLLVKNATVLDVGCGAGRDTNFLHKKGFDVTGLDLSTGLIKIARNSYPKLDFILGNMTSLPFKDNSFDGVWSHASLLHLESIEDVKNALSEFKRVLTNKGILHILVKAQIGSDKTAVVSDNLSKHDRFFQYFTVSEVKSLLSVLNFKIVYINQYKETDNNPNGRIGVEWIIVYAKNNK